MIFDNKHLAPDEFKEYIELSDSKKQLTEDQKKFLNDVEHHLTTCFKCNAEYLFLKSVYLKKVSNYESPKKTRIKVLAVSALIIIFFTLFQIIFLSDKKTEEKLVDLDNENKAIVNDSLEENNKTESFITKEDSLKKELLIGKETRNNVLINLLYAYIDQKKSRETELSLAEFSEENDVVLPKAFIEDFRQDLRIKNISLRDTENVTILSPENLSILTTPIVFEWEKITDSVTVVIKNNLNEIIWEIQTNSSSKVEFNESLEPGTYYWDIRIKDKLRRKSKFFIKP